ncbi:MAG TPA: hypothetical protein DCX52_08360 [Massilia sp.]|nr:hypothetical protein [Massilia sp.]
MTHSGIKRLVVEGLHEQFDVDITLKPGLNIIYGKNGRGKTTVLHILVNALELDFKRFDYLNFRRIVITTFNGTELVIIKTHGIGIQVLLNGAATSFTGDAQTLSDVESASIRAALGPRPTYLPAFRSVLERVRYEYISPYRDTRQDADIELITQKEQQALREASEAREGVSETRAIRDEATLTARKTVQCRQWFGSFVPVVRYPSIIDVDDGLSSEWRSAQLKMAQREQSMFADVFVQVFRTIVGLDERKGSFQNEDALIASVAELLDTTGNETGTQGPSAIYGRLLEAAAFLKQKGERDSKSVETSVLQLYFETLSTRKSERTSAFQKSRDFESSINKFLDKKTLKIGESNLRRGIQSSVRVGTEGGRSYGLSALSSGEKQILTMLYSASRSRFKRGIFLIDEPELSLHIDWQRKILRELMAQAPDCQLIACTHSPEVGADHFDETQDFEPTPTMPLMTDLFDEADEGEE